MPNRFFHIKEKALTLLLDLDINSYPIDVFEIVSRMDKCEITTYTNFAQQSKSDTYNVSLFMGSKDAAINYNPKEDTHIIVYNDKVTNSGKVRWSIAHEIGHSILEHTLDPDFNIHRKANDSKYKLYESEANIFARELLSNLCLIYDVSISNNIEITSPNDIASICGLSKQASEFRYSAYKKWLDNKLLSESSSGEKKASVEENMLSERFVKNNTNNIDVYTPSNHNVRGKIFIFCKHCENKYELTNEQPNYCCICGEEFKFNIKGDLDMIYEGYELDSRGKALVCPVCDNEEKGNGPYCFICGNYTINKCLNDDCGEIAPGNARYCEYCGDATTFFNSNFLNAYNKNNDPVPVAPVVPVFNVNEFTTNTFNAPTFEDDDIPF